MVAGYCLFLPILAHLSFLFLYPRPRATNFLHLAAQPPITLSSPSRPLPAATTIAAITSPSSFFNCCSTLHHHFFPPLLPHLGCCPLSCSLSPILTETPPQPIALSKVSATLTHTTTFCSLFLTLKANHTGLLSSSPYRL
ncbi:hypothetical protein AMTRI_Chr04g246900 [Amborella trichopoda]